MGCKETNRIFRTIIERSVMSNNDEYSLYTNKEMTQEIVDRMPKTMFSENHLVVSRPVFDIEIEEGLDVFRSKTMVSCFDEKIPEITKFFDSLFEMKKCINRMKEIHSDKNEEELKKIIKNFMVRHYTCHFYDCMSGGLKKYAGLILCEFIKQMGIDEKMELYPKQDGYYTVKDFLNEFRNNGKLHEIIRKLNKDKKLPSISLI